MAVSKPLDLTELTEQFGGFGRFQKWVFALACYACALSGLMVVNFTFVGYEPLHRCLVPACESSNSTYNETFLNFTTPYNVKDNGWEKCSMYGRSAPEDVESCEEDSFDITKTVNCSAYIYDTSMFSSSIVTEFDLVCERSWLQPTASSIYMVGMLFGALLLGDLADRIGRKKGLVVSAVIFLLGGMVSASVSQYYAFLAARVVTAAGSVALFQIGFIIALELVCPEWRTFVGMMIEIPFALGEASMAFYAYFIREWRWLQVVCTSPALFILSFWWILPESIRWLVARGKRKEAKQVIRWIEKVNKISVPMNLYEGLDSRNEINLAVVDSSTKPKEVFENNDTVEKRNVLDILRYPNMRKRALNLIFCWIVVTLSYYGLSANTANLGGDIFVNFVAIMLIEVPSYMLAYFVLDHMGRKGTLCFVMLLGGISSLLCGLTPSGMNWLTVTFSMVGKFGISAGFGVVYIYTAEIFPTSYRSIGIGTCSMSARIGGILAPFIANLGKVSRPLPLFIFGTLAITSGILIVFLPETLGNELPQTLEESESFGMDQSTLYFSCCSQRRKIKNSPTNTQNQILNCDT